MNIQRLCFCPITSPKKKQHESIALITPKGFQNYIKVQKPSQGKSAKSIIRLSQSKYQNDDSQQYQFNRETYVQPEKMHGRAKNDINSKISIIQSKQIRSSGKINLGKRVKQLASPIKDKQIFEKKY